MTTLDGRAVHTRADIVDRRGLSLSHLEKLWRERGTNGHPPSVGRTARGMAWDAEAWDAWYATLATDPPGSADREALASASGLSVSHLERLWSERAHNRHPDAVAKRGSLLWDLKTWLAWYRDDYRRSLRGRVISYDGRRDDLVTLSEAARVLHLEPKSVAHYPKRPPVGWPEPVEEETTPGGLVRRKYRLGDIWKYGENTHHGGGRPRGGTTAERRYPYDGDPRLAHARAALAARPDAGPELARELAREHGGTAGTWSHIVTAARNHPA